MSIEQPVLFVSIKPRFAEKILSGEKSVELRRVRPAAAGAGTLVVIYASSPACQVVGTGRVKAIEEGSPTAIWQRHQKVLGLPRSEYRAYFAGVTLAVGIVLEDVRALRASVPLASLRARLTGFAPPQSFRYLDAETTRTLTFS
jgi:predicted transcriptional regulator